MGKVNTDALIAAEWLRRNRLPGPDGRPYEARGQCADFLDSTDPAVILCGPAECAKTWTACMKLLLACVLYPGVQCAIIREHFNMLAGTVVQTFRRVAGFPDGVDYSSNYKCTQYGGKIPTRFNFKNGSVIWLGGMDNEHGGSALSSERYKIYVCQAEQLALNSWQTITTRCTGRGFTYPNPQLFADCNPGASKHWIRDLAADGKLRLLNAKHVDNPTLYNRLGVITDQGVRTMAALNNLTGMLRKRLRDGLWASAEGVVYDLFDPGIHVIDRPWSEMRSFGLAIDDGYGKGHPAAILLVGADPQNRWHVFDEIYEEKLTHSMIADKAAVWWRNPVSIASGPSDDTRQCIDCSSDAASPGLIAELQARGVDAIGGKGKVFDGIQLVNKRLQVQGDGRPNLTVSSRCRNMINEFESYIWKPDRPKDEPVKDNDHALDAIRYKCDVDAEPSGAITDVSQFHSPPATGFGTPFDFSILSEKDL